LSQSGDVLLHYRLLETLGKGGGGVVWRAFDTQLGREIALKRLPETVAGDPEALERFEREARAVAALNHPNIVTIHAIERAEGAPFLTMELVRGQTLNRLIGGGGLPLERLFELAGPLVDAVAAAPQRGVTHRDLKPRNIMVTDAGQVKVLDFGLARVAPSVASGTDMSSITTETQSRAGQLIGTLPYMSPEQVQGRALDARSDIFSIGVILYEMATGHRPFAGGSPADLIASILRDPTPSPAAVRAELPLGFARVVERCLEKDPRRRLQSCVDLKAGLDDLQREGSEYVRSFGPSVAVLPFTDMSQEKDQEYFCEGMAEELIAALTRIQGLRVASRTSSFLFRGTSLDTREIGRRLQVSTLLEGSVRKAADQLRVTAQLSDVATGYHLWTERYDRQLEDVFAVQDEIAESIARALKVALKPQAQPAPRKAPTKSLGAYDFYLRGRKYYFEYRRRGVEYALDMFQQAIQLDPTYARAWAGISDCCAFLFMYGGRDEAHRRRAEEASRQALELDVTLAESHAAHGLALSLLERDDEATAAFETAMQLDPDLYEPRYFYARHCFAKGELDKAVGLYEQASAVQPDGYQAPILMAQIFDALGRPGEATAARRRGLALAEERLRLSPDDVRARYLGANALVALGERTKGLQWARAARALDPDEPMLLYNIGCICAMAGERDEALDCLEKAAAARGIAQRDWYEHDSDLDSLRDEPRFQAILDSLS
jgi:non-specific serine/threonine protein kinase